MSRDPLWYRLVDDAAVFPPGNTPWPQALAEHRGHRRVGYGEMVGPLLVPALRADEFLAALAAEGAEAVADDPLLVGLIGPVDALVPALALLTLHAPRAEVVAVEVPPVPPDDLGAAVAALVALGVPAVWCEVPWGATGVSAVDALGVIAPEGGSVRVGAKLRTGGTTADAATPVDDLARFLRATVAAGMPFKLTAGLHHAVRGPDRVTGGTTHGVLNVVAATDAVLESADESAVHALLAETDGAVLADQVRALPAGRRRRVREAWASFGCCGVTDPLRELAALQVLAADGLDPPTTAVLHAVPAPLPEEVP